MKRPTRSPNARLASCVVNAIVLIALIIAYVFFYAMLGGGGRTLQQISSLIVFALYLSVLFLVTKQRFDIYLFVIYLSCSIASAVGFALVWQFSLAKSLVVVTCLFVLAITSPWWLKSI